MGLGNPGPGLRGTRHNLGFMVLEELAEGYKATWKELPGHSAHTTIRIGQRDILLFRPLTYMNMSGLAVRDAIVWTGIRQEQMLVIHDDLDLPLGRLKLVRQGGSGGHRGVESIIQTLGTKEFPRLKVGIGRPRQGEKVVDFVLGQVYEDESELFNLVVEEAIKACVMVIELGVEKAMNTVNSKKIISKEDKS